MLDSSKPDGATLLSELPVYQRETREYVNSLVEGMGAADVTELTSDASNLIVGTDLSENSIEVVKYSGAASLQTITGGYNGMMKVFILQTDTIDIVKGSLTTGGEIHLNSYNNLDGRAGDVIALVNLGGDPGASINGYWQELYRTLAT